MPKKYSIKKLLWCVKDEDSVRFHVASDDYFGTIATVISLLKQQSKKDDSEKTAILDKAFKNLENDLMYLQKNYQICPRPARQTKPSTKNKNKTPKGRLKSQ